MKWLIWIMVFLTLGVGFKDMLNVSLYLMQRDSLAKTVCVNQKTKKCKGKCFLSKKLKESHEDRSKNNPLPPNNDMKDYFLPVIRTSFWVHSPCELEVNFFYQQVVFFKYLKVPTEPPDNCILA